MVANGRSSLNERDLLTTTLTRWTSFISLTKTSLEDDRRSADPARSAEPNTASAAPRAIAHKARRPPPLLLATLPPPILFPFAAMHRSRCDPACRIRRDHRPSSTSFARTDLYRAPAP